MLSILEKQLARRFKKLTALCRVRFCNLATKYLLLLATTGADMARTNKRKRREADCSDDEDPVGHPSGNTNGFGVARTLSLLHDAKSQAADDSAIATAGSDATPTEGAHDQAKDGVSVQRPTKKKRVDGEKTKYPVLTYVEGRLQSSIRISDLQNLLLYCFADGIAPQWISIKHSGHIRKIVVLMVPGLEMGMFDGTVPLKPQPEDEDSRSSQASNAEQKDPDANKSAEEDEDKANFLRWKQGLPLEDRSHRFNPRSLTRDNLPEPLQPLADMFPHIWPVKAPGDSKYNKVHSPLQAILLSSLPKNKESGGKGPKPPKVDKSYVPKRTPITAFISSVDNLRENDYVLHPALLSTEKEKLALAENRKRAGQSTEDGWVDTHVSSWEAGQVPEHEIQQGSVTAGRDITYQLGTVGWRSGVG